MIMTATITDFDYEDDYCFITSSIFFLLLYTWAVGVSVLVYFNKNISLPVPLLYYVSMLFQFSIAICQLFILLTVRPLNQNTTDAQQKPKKEWVGNHFQVARKRST